MMADQDGTLRNIEEGKVQQKVQRRATYLKEPAVCQCRCIADDVAAAIQVQQPCAHFQPLQTCQTVACQVEDRN
jgi:hypothetical protein